MSLLSFFTNVKFYPKVGTKVAPFLNIVYMNSYTSQAFQSGYAILPVTPSFFNYMINWCQIVLLIRRGSLHHLQET